MCKKGEHLASVQTLVFRKIQLRIAGIGRGVKNIFDFSFVSWKNVIFLVVFARMVQTHLIFSRKKKFLKSSPELKEKVLCKKGENFELVQALVFRKIKLRIAGIGRGVKNIFVFSFVSWKKAF